MARILLLSAADVREALPMAEAIAAMREAFRRLSAGEDIVPPRIRLALPGARGDALFMPSYSPLERRVGLKVITLHDANPEKGLPRIRALVLLLDAADGSPLAIVHGGELTAIRTGAASGAATEILARTASTRAAVFGAGLQARRQLEAVCAVRRIESARVFDPCGEAAGRFAREMAATLGIPVDAAPSPAGALDGADIVCTATTSAVPVFDDRDLAPGAHINAIGCYRPAEREIPGETVERARVVVDSLEAALEEAGDLVLPLREGRIARAHIETELGEVIGGRKEGRRSEGEVTLFKSVGVATQDLAAAARAFERARAAGLGRDVDLDDAP